MYLKTGIRNCSSLRCSADWLFARGEVYVPKPAPTKAGSAYRQPEMGCRAFSPWFGAAAWLRATNTVLSTLNIGAVSLHLPMIARLGRKANHSRVLRTIWSLSASYISAPSVPGRCVHLPIMLAYW